MGCSRRAAVVPANAAVGWAKARSDVPTVHHCARCEMVGTLRFAHPTSYEFSRTRVSSASPATKTLSVSARRGDGGT